MRKRKEKEYGPPMRIWKETHERLRRRAFRERKTMVEVLHDLLTPPKPLRVRGTIS
jgi:hypothetical protein